MGKFKDTKETWHKLSVLIAVSGLYNLFGSARFITKC